VFFLVVEYLVVNVFLVQREGQQQKQVAARHGHVLEPEKATRHGIPHAMMRRQGWAVHWHALTTHAMTTPGRGWAG
jgi:hypothetical protein